MYVRFLNLASSVPCTKPRIDVALQKNEREICGIRGVRTHPCLGDDRPRRTHRHVPLQRIKDIYQPPSEFAAARFSSKTFFETRFWQGDFLRCVWISHGEERGGGDKAHKVSVVSCADSVAYPRAVVVEIPDAVTLTEIRGRESAQGICRGGRICAVKKQSRGRENSGGN